MKLEVVEYKEDEGVITLDIDDEGKALLMEAGLNALLRDGLEKMLKEYEDGKSNG